MKFTSYLIIFTRIFHICGLMLLLTFCGCSRVQNFYLINFDILNLKIDEATITIKYINGGKREIPLNITTDRNHKKHIIISFGNTQIPTKIILKNSTSSYIISFVKKTHDGYIYSFNHKLYFIDKDKHILDFKAPLLCKSGQ